MNEIDLIIRFLESRGSSVKDVKYYTEFFNVYQHGGFKWLGESLGYSPQSVWFFGNVNMDVALTGTFNLVEKNVLKIWFKSVLKDTNINEGGYHLGINTGMSLLGDGTYKGQRIRYGLGCNYFQCLKQEFTGTGNFNADISFNGYLFRMS